MKAPDPLYYSDYLELDTLLSCQRPRSAARGKSAHDEMLFIIVHQTYELWFKQILFEMDSVMALFAKEPVDESDMGVAVSRLERIVEIQKILVDQISVLETMTPLDFLEFRDLLYPASGFQSWQFRLVENLMGLAPAQRHLFAGGAYHAALEPAHRRLVEESEARPSLLALVERWLERTPFLDTSAFKFLEAYRGAVERMLEADREVVRTNPRLSEEERVRELAEFGATEESFRALFDESRHRALVETGERRLSYRATLAALFIHLYRDQPILHLPYRFLTALVEMDGWFTAWRNRHALMVMKMLGTKIGTGGSSGYGYLKVTAEKHKVFRDLANLSTFLIPRSALPALPDDVRRSLGFSYESGAGGSGR